MFLMMQMRCFNVLKPVNQVTNSADIIDQLNTGGQIYKNETIPLICSRMAIIVSDKNEEDISVDRFFIHYDTDAEEMEPEGYRRYTDLLWELYGEEGWQEEWDELYPDLWIKDGLSAITVCSQQTEEGRIAKMLLNQYDHTFDLLDRVQVIKECGNSEEVINAVQIHHAQAGFCYVTDLEEMRALRIAEILDQTDDSASVYQVCRLAESDHKEESKLFLEFLQGDHAKRFFEDFGFKWMR